MATSTGEQAGEGNKPPAENSGAPAENADLRKDPIMQSLIETLGVAVEQEAKAGESPEAPPIKPADEKPPDQPPAAKPTGTVKPRMDPRKIAEEAARKVLQEHRTTPLPSSQPAAAKPKQDEPPQPNPDDEKLTPEQRDELKDAAFAEKEDPAKFSGIGAKLRAFYAKVAAYMAEHSEDGSTFGEDDRDFLNFVRANKPPEWRAVAANMRLERIADERAEKKLKAREEQMQARTAKVEKVANTAAAKPMIDGAVAEYESTISQALTTDDPVVQEVHDQYIRAGRTLVETYMRLANSVDDFDPTNPDHVWLNTFVAQHGEAMAESVKEVGGKKFVSPTKYAEMHAAGKDVSGFTTVTPADIIKGLSGKAAEMAKSAAEQKVQDLQSKGYARAAKNPPSSDGKKPEAKPAQPPATIHATTSRAPGAIVPNATQEKHIGHEIAETLGLNG